MATDTQRQLRGILGRTGDADNSWVETPEIDNAMALMVESHQRDPAVVALYAQFREAVAERDALLPEHAKATTASEATRRRVWDAYSKIQSANNRAIKIKRAMELLK